MALESSAQKLNKSASQELLRARESGIALPEIAELEKPIKIIIEKIRGKIEKGEYGLIIGDDVSGRIPALILGGFIKKLAKIKGVRDPELIFIPGKLENNANLKKQLQDYISKHGVNAGDNILIITEAIKSGSTLNILSRTLITLGHKCDIATMGVEGSDSEYHIMRREENLTGADIFSGEFEREGGGPTPWNPNTPTVFREKSVSGVSKQEGDLVSHILIPKHKDSEVHSRIRKKVNQSRTEVGVLVDRLVEWYLSQDKAKN